MENELPNQVVAGDTPSNPSPPETPLMQKIANHKHTPIILTFIMLVLLFATTALIAFQVGQNQEAAKSEVIDDQPVPTASISSENNLSDWKVYQDNDVGFRLKYPLSWKVRITSPTQLYQDQISPSVYTGSIEISNESSNIEVIFGDGFGGALCGDEDSAFADGKLVIISSTAGDISVCQIIQNNSILHNGSCADCGGPKKEATSFIFNSNSGTAEVELIHQILSTFEFMGSNKSLVSVVYDGGLCPEGVCQTTYSILEKGTVLKNEQEVMNLDQTQLDELKQLVADADYEEIKATPFTDTCPIVYDGQEVIYTFYLDEQTEVIPNCTYEVNENHPLFQKVTEIIETAE